MCDVHKAVQFILGSWSIANTLKGQGREKGGLLVLRGQRPRSGGLYTNYHPDGVSRQKGVCVYVYVEVGKCMQVCWWIWVA